MSVFALTGDLGSGKTTILKFFKKKKAEVLNIDDVVHRYYSDKDSKVYKEIKRKFPSAIIKNKISRKRLSKIVFNDRKKLNILEKIIHPPVIRELKEWIRMNYNKRIAVVEVPLLFEKNLEKYFDGVILVVVKRSILIDRIRKKRNLSRKELNKRFLLYNPIEEKIKKADFIIDNNLGMKELYNKVNILWKKLNSYN